MTVTEAPTEIVGMEWVSAYTGIPLNTLRYYRLRGEGPASFKLGRRVVYDRAVVEAWVDRARNGGRTGGAA